TRSPSSGPSRSNRLKPKSSRADTAPHSRPSAHARPDPRTTVLRLAPKPVSRAASFSRAASTSTESACSAPSRSPDLPARLSMAQRTATQNRNRRPEPSLSPQTDPRRRAAAYPAQWLAPLAPIRTPPNNRERPEFPSACRRAPPPDPHELRTARVAAPENSSPANPHRVRQSTRRSWFETGRRSTSRPIHETAATRSRASHDHTNPPPPSE